MEAMEKSNLVLAKILAKAIDNGISHWELEFKDLELDESFATYFYPCAQWLEREGLIRVQDYARTMGGLANGSIVNISITSLGMRALGEKVEVDGQEQELSRAVTCWVPGDHIDPRRHALFMARSVLREVRDGGRAC